MKPDYSAARTYALAQGPAGCGTRWNRGSGRHTVATVKKALITPVRDQWTVTVADGPDLDVKGNIVDHEYTIEDGRSTVAEVSRKWFRVAGTYRVEVAPGPRRHRGSRLAAACRKGSPACW
jgi:hypothetical protein